MILQGYPTLLKIICLFIIILLSTAVVAFNDKLALDILSEQQMAEKRGRDREDEARKRRDPVNRQQREEKLSDSNAETEIGKQ